MSPFVSGFLMALFGGAALLWIAGGLVLAGIVTSHEGLPDRETYDGPAINWGDSIGLVAACVVGAPFWLWLFLHERRRSAPIPQQQNTTQEKT